MWCRGSSGAILAGMFALKCGYECRICHIKKEKEGSHNGNTQPYVNEGINIVIDDFVSFGHTLIAIVQHMERLHTYDVMGDVKDVSLPLHVLMILDWEDAPEHTTDKFKHKIGKRV